MTKLFY